jgi:WD40 repeat protein
MDPNNPTQPSRIVRVIAPPLLLIAMLAVGLLAYKLVTGWHVSDDDNKELHTSTPTRFTTSTNIRVPAGSGSCHDVAVSRNGAFFVVALDNGASMFSMTSGSLVRTFKGRGVMPVSALALSHDGQRLVAAANPGNHPRLLMWDSSTGKLIYALKSQSLSVDLVAIKADGTRAVSLSEVAGSALHVWDLTTGGSEVIDLPADLGLRSLAMTEDGTKAYVEIGVEGDPSTVDPNTEGGAVESHLVEVDLVARKMVRDFGNVGPEISDLAISPDGKRLVSGQWDGNAYVWDLQSGKVIETLSGHTDWVDSLSFSADGILASGSMDGSIRTWRLGADKPTQVLKERDMVESVAIAPDGHTLVTCLNNGTVRKWKVE